MDLGTYNNSTTYFHHADWLGTIRALSTVAGASNQTCTSLAYGDASTCVGPDRSALHFTDHEYDHDSALTHFQFRQLSTTEGRWIVPDPAGRGSVDPAYPQTWNRYEYVRNNPTGAVDPAGLCDVVIGGITQSSMDTGATGLTSFANSIGADLAFPYAGGGFPGGVVDVVSAGAGLPNNGVHTVVAAITAAANDPGPINIFTFSGGAQAFNTALAYLPADIQGRINNVTYVSPGGLSDLSGGNGEATVISDPFSIIDNTISGGSVGQASLRETPCGHNSNCSFPQQNLFLLGRSGNPCTFTPATFSRGGSGGPVWNFPGWWVGLGWGPPIEVVTHQISFPDDGD